MEEKVDRLLSFITFSPITQTFAIFPTLVLLCYIVGFFPVWVGLIGSLLFYIIAMHKKERERFNKSYLWTLRSLIHNRGELPNTQNGEDEKTTGVGSAGETLVLQNLASIWWKTSARKLFQHSVLESLVNSLNENLATKTTMIDKFLPGTVEISTESPRLISIKSSYSSYNSLVSIQNRRHVKKR